jgi:fluoride exporter
MKNYLIVFAGCGIGGALRHCVNVWVPRVAGTNFPFHTLTVNVLGSFVMGVLAAYFALRAENSQAWRLFLTTGILGGFTTFSAFSLDTALLFERGDAATAVTYVLVSVLASIGGLFLGLQLIRSLV